MANTKNKDCTAYKNKVKYVAEYNKENCIKKNLIFNKNNENDMKILNHLESNKPINTYIKELILREIK